MGCAGCGRGPCSCAVQAGEGVGIAGTGTPSDPWIFTASGGGGGGGATATEIEYDEATDTWTLNDTSNPLVSLAGSTITFLMAGKYAVFGRYAMGVSDATFGDVYAFFVSFSLGGAVQGAGVNNGSSAGITQSSVGALVDSEVGDSVALTAMFQAFDATTGTALNSAHDGSGRLTLVCFPS